MIKTILTLLFLAGLTACGDYEGRKTNCWSGGGSLSFSQTPDVTMGCADWTEIGG